MNDRKRNIADRFSGFEPEVDESTIDKSWEKIRYFLPQEKKRRGWIWFKNKGFGRALWMLAPLALCGLVALLLRSPATEKTPVAHVHKITNKATERGAGSETAERAGVITPQNAKDAAQQTPGQNNESRSVKQNFVNKSVQQNVENKTVAQNSENLPVAAKNNRPSEHNPVQAAQLPASTGKALSQAAAPVVTLFKGEGTGSVVNENETLLAGPVKDLPGSETQTYQQLQPVFLSRISSERTDSVPVSINGDVTSPFPAFRKWAVELFGGPCWSNTQLKYGKELLAPAKQAVDFSFGLGVVLQMNRKWQAYGNARLTRNSFMYEKELQGNLVVEREVETQSTTPLLVVDTIIRYLPSSSYHRVTSASMYNFCLGASYSLFRKRKISLEASLGVSLKYSAYHTVLQNTQQSDTLNYIRTLNAPPLPDEIRLAAEYDQKHKFMSWGLVPGLTLVYQFHSRLGLIARPSGFIQLSKTSKSRQEPYRLKQNNVFVDLGLRFKF